MAMSSTSPLLPPPTSSTLNGEKHFASIILNEEAEEEIDDEMENDDGTPTSKHHSIHYSSPASLRPSIHPSPSRTPALKAQSSNSHQHYSQSQSGSNTPNYNRTSISAVSFFTSNKLSDNNEPLLMVRTAMFEASFSSKICLGLMIVSIITIIASITLISVVKQTKSFSPISLFHSSNPYSSSFFSSQYYFWPMNATSTHPSYTPALSSIYSIDKTPALPPWGAYPEDHPDSPPVLQVSFLIRTSSVYSSIVLYTIRSIELSMKDDIKAGNLELIIVLSAESLDDSAFAKLLPDWVKVYYEPEPAYYQLWEAEVSTEANGGNQPKKAAQRSMYSHLISDRYTEKPYVCLLDPDQIFMTLSPLPLMFDWDEVDHIYKPVYLCKGYAEPYYSGSYRFWDYSDTNLKSSDLGCMYQLPVCVHRSTLQQFRVAFNNYYNQRNPALFEEEKLNPDEDRDSNYLSLLRKKYSTDTEFFSYVTNQVIPPSAFDLSYMRAVQEVELDSNNRICHFCILGSYIYTNIEERAKYSFHVVNPSMHCQQLRPAAHVSYLGSFLSLGVEKFSSEYFSISDQLLQESYCHSLSPATSDTRDYHRCEVLGYTFDASPYYNPKQVGAPKIRPPYIPESVLNQTALIQFEIWPPFDNSVKQELKCKPYLMQRAQQVKL